MEKTCIVIPAYNEEKRIGATLESYQRFFSELKKEKKIDYEILIVLNACRDRTIEIVRRFSKKNKEIKFLEFEQGGKGFAITEGFKDAVRKDFELIGFVDADMATPPEAFYDMIKFLRSNKNYAGVIANRWDKRSRIKTRQTLLRRFVSRGFNVIVRTLFFIPSRDTQCGAKLFRKELLKKIIPRLGASEWSFDVDLLFYSRRERGKIKSIPTIWEDKRGSKIDLKKTPLKMFMSVIRLRLVHSPLKFVVRFYRAIPENINPIKKILNKRK